MVEPLSKRLRNRTLGPEEREKISKQRMNLDISYLTDKSKASGLGSKQAPVKITIPKSLKQSTLQKKPTPAEQERQKRDEEFDQAFKEHRRRSKGLPEDSASSNSLIDRIDTRKINVNDILEEASGSAFQKSLHHQRPYRPERASKNSKKRKVRDDSIEDLGAELPESDSEYPEEQLPPQQITSKKAANPRRGKTEKKQAGRPKRQPSKNDPKSKHAELTTAKGPTEKRRQSSHRSDSQNSDEKSKPKAAAEEPKQPQARQGRKKAYIDISPEEIDEILSHDANLVEMIGSLDNNRKVLSHAPLMRFFKNTLAEINPVLSTSQTTLQYYERVFTKFIMPRVCFTYWDIKNDQETYEHWPEALKAEEFLMRALKENYEEDLKHKFIYDV